MSWSRNRSVVERALHKEVRLYREGYLSYLDGERQVPPSLELLSEKARRIVGLWFRSLAVRPTAAELLAQVKDDVNACCQCGSTTHDHLVETEVMWRCQVCKRHVCGRCTLTVPGSHPLEYYGMTLCSTECWEKAGKPDD